MLVFSALYLSELFFLDSTFTKTTNDNSKISLNNSLKESKIMTVKELIEKLKQCQQNANVIQVDGFGYEFEIHAVNDNGNTVYLREN